MGNILDDFIRKIIMILGLGFGKDFGRILDVGFGLGVESGVLE